MKRLATLVIAAAIVLAGCATDAATLPDGVTASVYQNRFDYTDAALTITRASLESTRFASPAAFDRSQVIPAGGARDLRHGSDRLHACRRNFRFRLAHAERCERQPEDSRRQGHRAAESGRRGWRGCLLTALGERGRRRFGGERHPVVLCAGALRPARSGRIYIPASDAVRASLYDFFADYCDLP